MNVTDPDMRFSRAGDQHSCEIDGETAILSLKSKKYFGLNAVGALIWQELEADRSLAELTKAVLDEFETSEEECRADVASLLHELIAADLVILAPRT
jgi:Coenzyme PQQ synthesis protein D (PqqD)